MSYSETYSSSVHYSGSVTVSYPASETGGSKTVDYSGDIPVNITIHVDTDAFDQSVDGTNTALAVVAGALTTAQAAQVAEVTRAGEQIAQTATQGFFRLLANEMSAQTSEFSSSCKASAGLLTEEAQQVSHIHEQMVADYRAIKSRYLRIFHELDRELDRRVRELDREAFALSKQGMRDVVGGPYVESAAAVVLQGQDVSAIQLRLQTARTKHGAAASLDALGEVCGYLGDYAREVNGLMEQTQGAEGTIYAPVVYAQEHDLDARGERVVVHGGDLAQGHKVTRAVISRCAQSGQSHDASKGLDGRTASEQEALDQSFMRLLERYSANGGDERVVNRIAQMYQQDIGARR